jgi:hypothetical protein
VWVVYPRMRNAPQHQRPRLQPGAGGVSRPWKTNDTAPAFVSALTAVSRDFTEAPLQVRFPTPTTGRRSRLLMTTIVAHDEIAFRCKCDTDTHGGLTPADPRPDVRLCIAKIVFSPTDVRYATGAGGVSPPWETKRRCKSQPRISDDMRACNQERLA